MNTNECGFCQHKYVLLPWQRQPVFHSLFIHVRSLYEVAQSLYLVASYLLVVGGGACLVVVSGGGIYCVVSTCCC